MLLFLWTKPGVWMVWTKERVSSGLYDQLCIFSWIQLNVLYCGWSVTLWFYLTTEYCWSQDGPWRWLSALMVSDMWSTWIQPSVSSIKHRNFKHSDFIYQSFRPNKMWWYHILFFHYLWLLAIYNSLLWKWNWWERSNIVSMIINIVYRMVKER